jgi:hypothetical protein
VQQELRTSHARLKRTQSQLSSLLSTSVRATKRQKAELFVLKRAWAKERRYREVSRSLR